MNNHPTVKDVYGLLGGINTDIDWLTKSIENLQKDFKEHTRNHRQMWYWIIPTALLLAQFLTQILRGFM